MSLVHVWQDAVDHHVLLPQCDVILHHGGSGTTAAGKGVGDHATHPRLQTRLVLPPTL
jgi:hypothetical protein